MRTEGDWIVQTDKETICREGARVARAYDPEFPEKVTKQTEANAHLIVAAVNACKKINPENPMAAAEALPKFYEAGVIALGFLVVLDTKASREVADIVRQALARGE